MAVGYSCPRLYVLQLHHVLGKFSLIPCCRMEMGKHLAYRDVLAVGGGRCMPIAWHIVNVKEMIPVHSTFISCQAEHILQSRQSSLSGYLMELYLDVRGPVILYVRCQNPLHTC